ncbi:MAG: isoleucine--tRNA ligase [Acholeplasmataceae bacterium]|nr:isoleucine--tRNA ligase [Acholeplasmataceae bacterium]
MAQKDYKDTLLLPKTDFPMRGNLGVKEVEIQQRWNDLDLFNKVQEKNKNNLEYIFHDGPPYPNGDIHAGTALNKILKDFIIRYQTMKGRHVFYQPGWDTHGLPIEVSLQRLGVDRKKMSKVEFRKKCEEFALTQVERQKAQFVRLGILSDWDNPYLTLTPDYEERQIRLFAKMVESGLIYRGQKPIYWSPSSESALAEAEIEYHDVTSDSIYVAFKLVNAKDELKDANIVIWTTTPWTLPANLATSAHPRLEYVLVKVNDDKFIVGKSRLEALVEILGWQDHKVLKTFKGSELENLEYKHPLYNRHSPIILGEHVTDEDGTGLVHTAPGHGADDYIVGVKYNLDILSPVNEEGYLTEEAGEFQGLFYDAANPKIVERLKEEGALLHHSKFNHSYPHDWRTRKPVIFRATPQWFASIDKLKTRLLDVINSEVAWKPKWGQIRMNNMISDREDWCISRQRVWGVPIPIFYCENGEPILDFDIINHVADLFREHGSNVWYEKEAKDLLPKGYTNPNSPNGIFTKEEDTMDVWFDSGTSFLTLGGKQSEIYLEGSDQYRGWFNSSLINSVAYMDKAPYKKVISHGFVLDSKGQKMSKSLGNTIDPNKVANQVGADVLRMWVASVNYENDVPLSDEILKQASENYRKIRNTFRFMLGNLNDFKPERDYIGFSIRGNLNRVLTLKSIELSNEVVKSYDNYDFERVIRLIMPFVINDISAFYLDYTKDILYILDEHNFERRSVQSTIYDILLRLLKLLTPIIPHTTSEVYQYLPHKEFEDIYLEDMPKVYEHKFSKYLEDFELFEEVREEFLKQIEIARSEKLVSKTLQADVIITMPKTHLDAINELEINLLQVLMVASIDVLVGDMIKVEVTKSNNLTCSRCWNLVPKLNEDEVCPRCEDVLKKGAK